MEDIKNINLVQLLDSSPEGKSVVDSWSRDFDYDDYLRVCDGYGAKSVSELDYTNLKQLLEQDMVINIGDPKPEYKCGTCGTSNKTQGLMCHHLECPKGK